MTTATDSPAPLARTLDEPLLRDLFEQAPADLSVPEDVGAIQRVKVRGFFRRRRALMLGLGLLLVIGAVVAFAGFGVAVGAGVAIGAVVIWLVPFFVVASSADDEFYATYATARGLTHHDDASMRGEIPLFHKGDKRDFGRVMQGTIAGQTAHLGHFTYTDISTDSEGNRSETDHDFTVLGYTLPATVAARYAGVYLSPSSWSFGRLQDRLSHDRKVELESREFSDRYTLRVVDAQDDIALYELFSPTFIHHLATDLQIHWEQVGEQLVFWRTGHEDGAADLDRFCNDSRYVLQRYLDEHR